MSSVIYFDLETQNMSYEVGGWANLEAVRLAVAATWDEDKEYRTWWERDAVELVQELANFDLIVGFNTNRFDYRVLAGYTGLATYLEQITFDLLLEIQLQGYPLVGLDAIARYNIGAQKLYKSAQAVELFRQGKLKELEEYVLMDVELTRLVTEHWEESGYIWLDSERQKFATWPGLRYTGFLAEGRFGT